MPGPTDTILYVCLEVESAAWPTILSIGDSGATVAQAYIPDGVARLILPAALLASSPLLPQGRRIEGRPYDPEPLGVFPYRGGVAIRVDDALVAIFYTH